MAVTFIPRERTLLDEAIPLLMQFGIQKNLQQQEFQHRKDIANKIPAGVAAQIEIMQQNADSMQTLRSAQTTKAKADAEVMNQKALILQGEAEALQTPEGKSAFVNKMRMEQLDKVLPDLSAAVAKGEEFWGAEAWPQVQAAYGEAISGVNSIVGLTPTPGRLTPTGEGSQLQQMQDAMDTVLTGLPGKTALGGGEAADQLNVANQLLTRAATPQGITSAEEELFYESLRSYQDIPGPIQTDTLTVPGFFRKDLNVKNATDEDLFAWKKMNFNQVSPDVQAQYRRVMFSRGLDPETGLILSVRNQLPTQRTTDPNESVLRDPLGLR